MSRWLRSNASFANVMSVTAVFIALGGSALAVTLAANSVGSPQIKANAVKSSEVAAAAVRTSDIAGNAVTAAKIPNNAVGGGEIANESVTDSEIAANAVENDEIAPNSVNSSRIADGSVAIADADDSLQLTCPAATVYLNGACIETASRAALAWDPARAVCTDPARDGRLPSLEELDIFRQRASVTLAVGGEWTQSMTGAGNAAAVEDGGAISTPILTDTRAFRCVVQPLGAPG
jgi:hypothetical protein